MLGCAGRGTLATAGPGERGAAGAMSRGRLRASDADREKVIDTLKAAFVQGWLTRDQLGVRAGQALVSRTYAELAAVTDGIPARLIGVAGPSALPAGRIREAGEQEGGCVDGVRDHPGSAGNCFPYLLRRILRPVPARLYRVDGDI